MLEEDAIMYHVIAKNFFGVCLISVFFWAESVSSRWSSEPHINGRCRKQRISLIKLTEWHDGQLNPNYVLFMIIWVSYISFPSETTSAFVLSKDSGMSTISSGGMTSNARCCECGISSANITRPHPNQWPTSWHYAYVHLLSLYRTLFSVWWLHFRRGMLFSDLDQNGFNHIMISIKWIQHSSLVFHDWLMQKRGLGTDRKDTTNFCVSWEADICVIKESLFVLEVFPTTLSLCLNSKLSLWRYAGHSISPAERWDYSMRYHEG